MKTIYVNSENNRSWSTSQEAWGWNNYPVEVEDGFTGGAMTCDPFTHVWTEDEPYEMTHEDHVSAAMWQRDRLVAEANAIIYDWAIDSSTGDITDDDMENLKVWRTYIKKLKSIDLSAAPDIDWPSKPE